ncbi:MAG: mechanosensitive ion channel [Calditrichae bacterium]|nr:mechanosensitive ion channel [Calditrichota bacterium]MCB9059541.1 mechanosensitive ion channel [Calditrichia bacterium]
MSTDVSEILDVVSSVFKFTLFEINQTPITLSSILMFFLVLLVFHLASRLFRRFILEKIMDRMKIEKGTRFTMTRTLHYIVMVIGAIVSFQFIGIDLSGLAVIFGLLSVGIGFGLQNVTSNFVAGLILLFERPIQIGDRVTVGDTEGDVEAINIRSTMIRTLNNISIIVPNSEFVANRVINWSHGDTRIRLDTEVGVSYNSDLDMVIKALTSVAEENPNILKNPKPEVLLKSFGDSSWNMVLRGWLNEPGRHHVIQSEINMAIVHKFRDMNIEIPFPQRDLHIKENKSET